MVSRDHGSSRPDVSLVDLTYVQIQVSMYASWTSIASHGRKGLRRRPSALLGVMLEGMHPNVVTSGRYLEAHETW